jgi:predicted nucleic acid-binding protein
MIFYYLDASAWVKRYYLETGTPWVQALFDSAPTVTCASLGLVEVMATLARKHKAQEIDSDAFEKKAQELEEDWQGFVQIHLTPEVVRRAKEVAKQRALRGADAVHLASALLLESRFVEAEDHLVLITSDHELKEVSQSCNIEVIDPETQNEA